jgi:hypothetical protein
MFRPTHPATLGVEYVRISKLDTAPPFYPASQQLLDPKMTKLFAGLRCNGGYDPVFGHDKTGSHPVFNNDKSRSIRNDKVFLMVYNQTTHTYVRVQRLGREKRIGGARIVVLSLVETIYKKKACFVHQASPNWLPGQAISQVFLKKFWPPGIIFTFAAF